MQHKHEEEARRADIFQEITVESEYFDNILSSQERTDPPTEEDFLKMLSKIKENVHLFSSGRHWKLIMIFQKCAAQFVQHFGKPCPLEIKETHMVRKIEA